MTIKTGTNGNFFFLKNKKWVDTRIIAKKHNPIPKTANLICVCEPFVGLPLTKKIDPTHCFHVSDKFLAILRKSPVAKKTKMGNAYIFGPLFKGYSDYGYVYNDIGTIGIALYKPNTLDFTRLERDILEPLTHDSKKFTKAAREMGRDVLFNGEILGGDLGCLIFIHQDSRGEVDGLILENYFIFPLLEHVIREKVLTEPDVVHTLKFRKTLAGLPKGTALQRVMVS